VPDDAFVFLFLFDFYSVSERKNPLGLIDAFRRAFDPTDRAWLVLKTSHAEHDRAALAELERAGAGANVRVTDRVLDRAGVDAWMASADAYVSLHRSEGFGITLAEAMALGKPVIATGYGGNVDFMQDGSAFLLRHQARTLERDFGAYARGSSWAEPDLGHAAEIMRRVYDDPGAARQVAERGRADVQRTLAPAIVGRMMNERLRTIAARHPGLAS
jgi:glycosyltransferase involved in cell wall biosynthesis